MHEKKSHETLADNKKVRKFASKFKPNNLIIKS